MFTRQLTYGKGYSGTLANKCWVARITGTSQKYALARDFLEPDEVEREHFNRPRTKVFFTWRLDEGLYEASEGGERWIFIVFAKKDGSFTAFRPDDARLKAIIKLMDEGKSFREARIATKKEAVNGQSS